MDNELWNNNESWRLKELSSYDLQNGNTEDELNELSELMAQHFDCPIALVTVIDEHFQWFKGKTGTTEIGNQRSLSFCNYTLLQNDIMVVENALQDSRFKENPFVTGDFHIRFYAGIPILSIEGFKLGTICIYDTKPRTINAIQKNAMLLFSKQVSKLFHLKKINSLLRQRAEELIHIKSDVFEKFIENQEVEKKEISNYLHEDFAQSIAAVLLILKRTNENNAGNNKSINNSIAQLEDVLLKIKELSYKISPNIETWMAPEELLPDYIKKIASTFSFKIVVKKIGKSHGITTNTLLNAIRVIEEWLKLMQQKKGIKKVQITIELKKEIILFLENSNINEVISLFEKDIVESIFYERVYSQGGKIELMHSSEGNNIVKVFLH